MPEQNLTKASFPRSSRGAVERRSGREYEAIIAYVVYRRCLRAPNTWTSPPGSKTRCPPTYFAQAALMPCLLAVSGVIAKSRDCHFQLRSKMAAVLHSGLVAGVGIFNGSVPIRRCWKVWMRAFRICGRSFDGGADGADSLLDFLFGRCQRIVRDVQRAFLYFGFDYAVQCFDRIGYLLLADGVSELLDFNSSGHGLA